MSNKNSGLDYAIFGTTLAAAIFSGITASKVNQMQKIQADKLAKEEFENELRQLVFDLEDGINRLKKYLDSSPLGVATSVWVVEKLAENIGLMPSAFQQFVDKDRTSRFFEQLAQIKYQANNLLGENEQREAERFFNLALHREDLKKLIAALEAKKEIDDTESQWKSLEENLKKRRNESGAQLGLKLSGFGVVAMLFVNLYVQDSVLSCIFLMTFLAFFVSLIALSNIFPPGYKELRDKRTAWRSKLLPHEKYLEICKTFGGEDLGTDVYKKIDDEIGDFFGKALEHDKNGEPLNNILEEILPGKKDK